MEVCYYWVGEYSLNFFLSVSRMGNNFSISIVSPRMSSPETQHKLCTDSGSIGLTGRNWSESEDMRMSHHGFISRWGGVPKIILQEETFWENGVGKRFATQELDIKKWMCERILQWSKMWIAYQEVKKDYWSEQTFLNTIQTAQAYAEYRNKLQSPWTSTNSFWKIVSSQFGYSVKQNAKHTQMTQANVSMCVYNRLCDWPMAKIDLEHVLLVMEVWLNYIANKDVGQSLMWAITKTDRWYMESYLTLSDFRT